jgi:predicted HTH domain antitoxin
MDTITITVELPRDLLVALNVPASETSERTREWVILELYREQLISAGKAAEVLGVTKRQFMDLLARREIPYLDLTAAELAEDVRAATAARTPHD